MMEHSSRHIPDLQALRGVAAAVVLLHHCSFLFRTSSAFHYWAEVLLNAHAAVMLFFVLSGYVLSRSLEARPLSIANCARFYMARLFRIYPALLVATTFAGVYLLSRPADSPSSTFSTWYLEYFVHPPTWTEYIRNAMAFGTALVPPTWSIQVEIMGSIAIPLIWIAMIQAWAPIALIGALLVTLLAHISRLHVLWSLEYLPSFVIGALAFHLQATLPRRLTNRTTLLLAVFVLVFFRRLNAAWRFDAGYDAFLPTLIESLAAALVVMSVVAQPVKALSRGFYVRLGDISYSLYLLHFTIMSALALAIGAMPIDPDLRAVLLMIITFTLTWSFSALSFGYIEKPGIRLGRVLADAYPKRAARQDC